MSLLSLLFAIQLGEGHAITPRVVVGVIVCFDRRLASLALAKCKLL